MSDFTFAEAKAQLRDLVERAMRGEQVRITRRRKPVARIVGIGRHEPKPIDRDALKALTDAMPVQQEPTRSWIRSVRDGAR
jgi:prevent-host-death family protein